MKILNAISKGIKTITDELQKPDSFRKGEQFEEYIRKYVFPQDRYKLIHKTHSYQSNKEDFAESSLLPDYKFKCLETEREFFVEVKFREGVYHQNKIEWCKPFQLKRYREIDRKGSPVFLALGLGDDPRSPEELFIIPVAKTEYCALYDSFLDKYKFHLQKPVFSGYLWKL
jgi:hypothetical protein